MKHLTFKFKFRAPRDPLVVKMEPPKNTERGERALDAIADGKMPVPDGYRGLTKAQLHSLGVRGVRLSKKHGLTYVDITPKRHDT